jgi:hypothetical protein
MGKDYKGFRLPLAQEFYVVGRSEYQPGKDRRQPKSFSCCTLRIEDPLKTRYQVSIYISCGCRYVSGIY